MKPIVHLRTGLHLRLLSEVVNNQVYTLMPVGIAITMVAAVKYARLSASIPVTYM
jgi:hypothetical protein